MRRFPRLPGRCRSWRRALLRAALGLFLTGLTMRHPEAAYLGPVAEAVIELARAGALP